MCILLFSSIASASDSGSEGAQDTGLSCVCILLFSSIASASDSGSEGAQDTGLSCVCVLLFSSIASASDSGSEGAQDTRFTYSCFTFGSWDYSLTSKEAVLNLSLGLANSIKVNYAISKFYRSTMKLKMNLIEIP